MKRVLMVRPSYRNAMMALGPVGYWRLGESSGTVAKDECGKNNGAYSNSPTLGVVGPLSGDPNTGMTVVVASGQNVQVPTNPALHPGDTLSLLVWMKRTAAGHEEIMFSGGNSDFIFLHSSDDKIYFQKKAVASLFASTATFTDTGWHFLAATKNPSNDIHVYRDGVDLAGSVSGSDIEASTTDISIGGIPSSSGSNATFTDAAIFSRALTAGEVATLYRIGRGF